MTTDAATIMLKREIEKARADRDALAAQVVGLLGKIKELEAELEREKGR